jgi:hypothetical protein
VGRKDRYLVLGPPPPSVLNPPYYYRTFVILIQYVGTPYR